jgi:hypothetical protein
MVRSPKACWAAGLAVLALLLAGTSCRRPRFPPRGDAAAVVVVVPRNDAASPPKVIEQEPNDSPEQAQILAINAEWPVVSVEGSLSAPGEAKGKDVDVFKFLVPGGRTEPAPAPPSADSGRPADDPRALARRLSFDIAAEGGAGLSVQILDEALKSMAAISIEVGETAGMPNLAVSPGRIYYLRIKPVVKAAKAAKTAKTEDVQVPACNYKLTVQIGDFEIADEREPNDVRETANPVAVVGTAELAGYHGWHHDQDFFRIALPEVLAGMDVDLDAVEGVAASLQVLDGSGGRLAFGKGRKGERLALRNVTVRPATANGDAASRNVYVVVRGESGQNRHQRYVLRITLAAPRLDAEVEPNDSPESATPVKDGTISGYLPVGDADCFRYQGEGQRDVTFEVAFPARVRGKLAAFRPGNPQPIGAAEAKKTRQTVVLPGIATLGQSILLRVSQGKADGNANDPYTLNITSAPSSNQKTGTANPQAPAPSN